MSCLLQSDQEELKFASLAVGLGAAGWASIGPGGIEIGERPHPHPAPAPASIGPGGIEIMKRINRRRRAYELQSDQEELK